MLHLWKHTDMNLVVNKMSQPNSDQLNMNTKRRVLSKFNVYTNTRL